MKKRFTFIVLVFFVFTSVGCGAISLNQKKKWPKAPTQEDLAKRLHSSKETMEPTTPTEKQTAAKAELQSMIAPQQLLKVYLKPSMVELCPDQQKQVINWLKTIENFKGQKYMVKGFSDNSIDSKKSNEQYSLERAANAKIFLVKQGITTNNIEYLAGKDSSNISQGKKRRVEISVLRRFDADIPLIPLPQTSIATLAENDSRLISLSEPTKYPDWNKFPAGYTVKQCGPICIAEKKIDDNNFDIIISIHESLIPEGATQFMPLGINEGWRKGDSVWPTPMWRETLSPQPAMFRRNIVCRDSKNKDLGYALINQAQRAGSCWAVSNSEIRMEKNKRDISSCIAFFLTPQGIQPVFSQ